MSEVNFSKIAKQLAEPFPLYWHEVKPGAGGGQGQVLALPFIPWHYYQERLDRVVGWNNWRAVYSPFDEGSVYCELTIYGVTKGDVGEAEDEEAPSSNNNQQQRRKGANPMFAGVAQAFRRACASFGLGRYLYQLDRYYARSEGKKITEKADEIVFKLLQGAGLDAYTRHRRAIGEASTLEELKEVGELIRYAKEVRDYNTKEGDEVKAVYLARKEALKAKSSAPAEEPRRAPYQVMTNPPGAVPSANDQRVLEEAAATMATTRAPKSSPASGFLPSERAQALSKDIADLRPGAAQEKDIYCRALKQAIVDAGRLGDISEKEAAELLERFRAKVNHQPAPQPQLKATAEGMRPADYDAEEVRIKGATSEEREAEYSELIAKGDRKHVDAYSKEIEADRNLMSSAVSRLKKKIADRRLYFGKTQEEAEATRASFDNTKTQRHGLPEQSAAVKKAEGQIRSCKDELALDLLVRDLSVAIGLSANDLDYLDGITVTRRNQIKEAAAVMSRTQEPLM